jgi:hypothetical protein
MDEPFSGAPIVVSSILTAAGFPVMAVSFPNHAL